MNTDFRLYFPAVLLGPKLHAFELPETMLVAYLLSTLSLTALQKLSHAGLLVVDPLSCPCRCRLRPNTRMTRWVILCLGLLRSWDISAVVASPNATVAFRK